MFIALSGFSLGLGPARSGWRFKSIATYAHRRARRILPPFWAALGFSLVTTWYVLAQPGWALPNGKSLVVCGLLVQGAFSVGSPSRAFWSIATSRPRPVVRFLTACCRGASAPAPIAST
jgi:peptidoglycan/LPS O-acetylase OafA/YrhL